MIEQLSDLHISSTLPLITPRALKERIPLTARASDTVVRGRETIKRILAKKDGRLLVIAGPCSIHDKRAAIEYAQRLNTLSGELDKHLYIVMRAYFEKPRTRMGWKGLINDPHLDDTYDLEGGLHMAREILTNIAEFGLPAATEVLDPIVPQYLADLESWAAVGARTTESQTHREMASGLSMPVGFKNSTDGNLQIAIDAMISARHAHRFLGIDQEGRTCVITTRGNPDGHIILRGGGNSANYDPVSTTTAAEQMEAANLPPLIMVDCSHANSDKRYKLQAHVLKSVIQQRLDGNTALVGVMLESNLFEGSQPISGGAQGLAYGVSITDPCLGWEDTERLLRFAHDELASGARSGRLRRSF